MKKLHLAASVVLFIVVASLTTFAQVQAPPKIGFIATDAFYDQKAGITRLVTANNQLQTEFASRVKELDEGGARLQAIGKDMSNMQKLPQAQFNQVAYNAKQEEGERLQRDLNYKKTDLESAVKKRREQLVSPISRDIGNAITEFAKKNGYGIVLDPGKLNEIGAVLYFGDGADVTKEFIAFYNARPASPAAPAAPKP